MKGGNGVRAANVVTLQQALPITFDAVDNLTGSRTKSAK